MIGPSMSSPDLLVIFVKAPRKGQVKTRLAAYIGEDLALKLYLAMVEDLLENVRESHHYDIQIMVWPEKSEEEVRNWLQWLGVIASQIPGDLGIKLNHAFGKGFKQGFKRIIIIGSDLPGLSSSLITQGFQQVEQYPLVLGPARDGGYYLIGLNSPQPQLLTKMSWSTPEVLSETIDRAHQSNLSYYLLKEMQDIDDYEDVLALRKSIKNVKINNLPHSAAAILEILNNK